MTVLADAAPSAPIDPRVQLVAEVSEFADSLVELHFLLARATSEVRTIAEDLLPRYPSGLLGASRHGPHGANAFVVSLCPSFELERTLDYLYANVEIEGAQWPKPASS